ncbi:hypothetical protein LJC27_03505, partial [Christensenellaceae bacterium OttesenSCG-928-M15]|nr:hypothetical protein [Christensenellaceae bacterium OttesenSCG-928-M15]
GVVSAKDIRISRNKAALEKDNVSFKGGFEKYRAYTDKQIENLGKSLDWSFFDPVPLRSGKLDGTLMFRKAYGMMRDVFASA